MVEENSYIQTPIAYFDVIERKIPVGYGGYIIGKNGTYKTDLWKHYGAQLILENDPNDPTKQIIQIAVPPEQKASVEEMIDKKLEKLKTKTVDTVTSSPGKLKPTVELGKMFGCYVMNMDMTNEIILILDNPEMNDKYIQLDNQMQEEYKKDNNCILPKPINQGCICVAYSNRAKYYRAYVKEYMDHAALVYFLDVGKFEVVLVERLKKIKVKFLELPFRAILAKWNNIQLNTSVANVEQIIHYKFMEQDRRPKKIYAFFTHKSCCIPFVNLYVNSPKHSEEKFVDLLELVTHLKLATAISSEVILSKYDSYFKVRNFDDFYANLVKFQSKVAE